MKRLCSVLLMLVLFHSSGLLAQDGRDQLNYSSIAQQLVLGNANGDANSGILPSVAMENGFGSFMENPASVALIDASYFNLGYLANYADNENSFQGNNVAFDNRVGRFGSAGLVYAVPTERGSLVVGGGYNLYSNINRTNSISTYNTNSTITDAFVDSGSDYHDIAFETYAIDWYDTQQTQLESIFRVGFAPGDYLGIAQEAEIKQRSNLGEVSIFMATEFMKDFFFGASLGMVTGKYSYERNFLEEDRDNLYDGDFIEPDNTGNNGTDINDILVYDKIDSEILGATIRAGFIYKLMPKLNIGANFTIPTKLIISEDYYSSITTGFDDGRDNYFDDFAGKYTYSVRKPSQYSVGIALDDFSGLSLSASAEFIDYRKTSIDLTRDNNLDFQEERYLRMEEEVIDSVINAEYNFTANLRGGIEYRTKFGLELRGGMGYYPGKSSKFSADKYIFSGGIGIPISREVFLDINTQYSRWNDRSVIYEYNDIQTGELKTEGIGETISQLNVLVGFKFRFY